MENSKDKSRGIQSIEIGFRILTAIQQGPGSVLLKEIASRARVTSSAAHNYLSSFVRTGMVKSDGRGQYRLGPSLAALGMTAARDVDQFDLVRDAAVDLSESTGLGAAIVIWNGGPVILFNRAHVRHHVFTLYNGPVELLWTAAGHVFAAYLPCEVTLPILQRDMPSPAFGDAERAQKLDEISAAVTSRGYSIVKLRALPGYVAVSAPVWNSQNDVVYALTITAPEGLVDVEDGSPHIQTLLSSARNLSRLLGASSEVWASNSL